MEWIDDCKSLLQGGAMKTRMNNSASEEDLRKRAASRLTGNAEDNVKRSAAALRVLYELAASPATAVDALAVLHELQVHQVELELQAEELRRLQTEAESALLRHIDLYDAAPVGLFTVDKDAVVQEANLTAASLLQCERDALRGQSLCRLLAPESAHALRGILSEAGEGRSTNACTLELPPVGATPGRYVHAAISRDSANTGFLLAFMPAGS